VAGTYSVYAEKSNFETVNISVSVVKGLSTTADFFLTELDTNASKIYGNISGIIRNSKDNSLIENVSIRTVPPTSIVSTDISGKYSLLNITPGNYIIYAEKANFDSLNISVIVQKGLTTTADFFINELDTNAFVTTGNIVGKIIDAKTGIAVQEAVITTTPATSSVTSDANGNYKIINLQPGAYTISVTKYGFQTTSTSIMVFAGNNTNADISLTEQSTGTISGVVRDDSTDVPIRGVSITTEPGTSSVTTDSLGHYTIVSLEPAQYSVIAQKLGYVSAQVSVLVIAEEQTTADIALQKD
jgi:protocatechuate 3,4-dioxygenase beta subunit